MMREGIHTADNERFLRLWSEVNSNTIVQNATSYKDIDKYGQSSRKFCGLPSYLLGLIQDMLNTDEFDIEENRLTIRSLLHIVELANDLNMRCWGEQKTPFGLTGIRYDNQYVGFKDETKIIAS